MLAPLLCAATLSMAMPGFALAQAPGDAAKVQSRSDGGAPDRTGSMLEEIVVTGTKQSRPQLNQAVPVTISAFSGDQIETLKLNNIGSLAYAIPNVSFEGVSSFKGVANFQIRGLGVNSSIASTAPTVGVFVDDVYLGIGTGVLLDTFDLEGIEVLRGPQGTIFGRNVTGGAVLLRNAQPRQEADFKMRLRAETGPEYSLAMAGGGGITETVSGRLAVLYRKDEGYFDDKTLGDKRFGTDEVSVVRPALRFENDRMDITLRGEHGRQKGDGPMVVAPDRDPDGAGPLPAYGYDYKNVYEDFRGTTDIEWRNATLTSRFDVAFGADAAITNIMGYRWIENLTNYASDGTPLVVSHNTGFTKQDQWSDELRYNGTFGAATVTTGLYYFTQKLLQLNRQIVINSTQGGEVKEDTVGVFGQVDYTLADKVVLQLGGRYTSEKKKAGISALASENPAVNQPGTFGVPGACVLGDARKSCNFQYRLSDSWSNFSPKIGIQYWAFEDVQLYATAQRAFRSGGFNVRYNSAGAPPPYDPEKQKAFEIGFKSDLFDRKTRLNGAVFLTKVENLQRDITIFDSVTLANKISTFNTADATTQGFELELVQEVLPGIVFNANVGYVDAEYDKILFDITQDPASAGGPAVNDFDLRQKLPRVSPWTYSAGINATRDMGFGQLTFQGSFSHRDRSFFPDYNTDRRDGAVPALPAVDVVDAQLSFEPRNGQFAITLYGKNLLDEFSLNSFTPIAYPSLKACACGVNEGRVIGLEATMKY